MILFSKNDRQAEIDIEKLEKKRQEIFSKLEAFHKAAKELERKDLPAIERYFNENDRHKVLVMALETWFELEEINIGIDLNRAANTITLPEPVEAFMLAWDEMHGVSNDPNKYWTPAKQEFRPLPVTKEEKEKIHKRYERYIQHNTDVDLVKYLWNTVNAINFTNMTTGKNISFAKVAGSMPWIVPLITASTTENDMGRKKYVFDINEDLFFLEPFQFTAFDEV